MSAVEEISIPVPWGHIAAKAWGSPDKPHLLAIHGLNDNAASFDQLMPFLDDQLYIVCVDLPGHGLSSHFPLGIHFTLLDCACALKVVVDHLHWTRFNVIAHSMGSNIAVYFTALFGEPVSRLILIDGFFAHIIPEEDFVLERCQVVLEKFFKSVNKFDKLYDYDGSIRKLSEERLKQVGNQQLKALQKRAFTKCENGYVFNNDRRMKLLTFSLFTASFHYGLVQSIQCHLLLIMTSEFEASSLPQTPTNQGSHSLLRKTLGSKLKTVGVQGSHDVHMENPQAIAPVIKQFLIQQRSHL